MGIGQEGLVPPVQNGGDGWQPLFIGKADNRALVCWVGFFISVSTRESFLARSKAAFTLAFLYPLLHICLIAILWATTPFGISTLVR